MILVRLPKKTSTPINVTTDGIELSSQSYPLVRIHVEGGISTFDGSNCSWWAGDGYAYAELKDDADTYQLMKDGYPVLNIKDAE